MENHLISFHSLTICSSPTPCPSQAVTAKQQAAYVTLNSAFPVPVFILKAITSAGAKSGMDRSLKKGKENGSSAC